MNQNSVVIEKLEEESLNAVLGGVNTQAFSQVMYMGGLSTAAISGVASIGLLTAAFICKYNGVDYKKRELLKDLSFSAGALAVAGAVVGGIAAKKSNVSAFPSFGKPGRNL